MKVFIIGDSISIHYGPYLEQYLKGFAEYARKEGKEEALRNLDIPQGANGGDSSMVLAYLQAMGEIDADYLLLNCGLHDIKTDPETGEKQVPVSRYEENLKAIVELVSTMKPELVWIRTTPCEEAVHNVKSSTFHRFSADCASYNKAADEIMKNAGVPIIDLYTFTENLASAHELYFDHVHFNEHIREKQGAFIAGWVVRDLMG